MRNPIRWAAIAAAAAALVASTTAAASGTSTSNAADEVHLTLTPSSAQLAACMPHARVKVEVELTTDRVGSDEFEVHASGLPPKTAFTVFLLQTAGAPFGAAEYIGDVTGDRHGKAKNSFHLIVQEAFASTLVNGNRERVDLNQVGMWFADPTSDDFCLGANSPVTPFDGDKEAGVQAFNSANAAPLPAP
jgi:hypothetical protein